MIEFENIIILEEPDNYPESAILWKDDNYIRLNNYAPIPLPKNGTYPAFYKYVPSDDAHFCGIYEQISKDNVLKELQKRIEIAEQRVNSLKNFYEKFSKTY